MVAVKRSVAFDAQIWKEAQAAARRQRTSLSALVNDAVAEHLAVQRGLRAMADWQAEHGEFTDDELASADAALDRALRSGQ